VSLIRRIHISMPADRHLSPAQNALKWGVVERIERLGYSAEIFNDPTGRKSLAASMVWTADAVDEVVRRCQGTVIIGLPRWKFESPERTDLLPTEFSQYEGAVARTLGLPLLVLRQEDVRDRVVFDRSFGPFVGVIPREASPSWLDTDAFQVPFGYWRGRLEQRRDLFLGYSGASSAVATRLRKFLENEIQATVLDWKRDFKPGRSILQEIEEARSRCSAGIFLFTKDDKLAAGTIRKAAPRDNVVLEAGYFISDKGKASVLIILEKGAKMPADLGGDIYASLENRKNLSPLKNTMRQFLATL
jgi:predicted nucleotide-binding protein with TIR-like domain